MTEPLVTLRRCFDDGRATFGMLEVGDRLLVTMEPPWAGNAQNVSCIPPGEYPLVLEKSARFANSDYGDGPGMLWELKEVLDRSECKFHGANWPYQLSGCIALGDLTVWSGASDPRKNGRGLIDSGDALELFHAALRPHKTARIKILRP